MGQYRVGTASVVNGDATVTFIGSLLLTYAATGDSFKLSGIDAIYSIASVTDDTHLELTVTWPGSTLSDQTYQIGVDWTPNNLFPEIWAGDRDWMFHLTTGLRMIDGLIGPTISPTFVTVKLSSLTNGYIPYHVSDASGLANSPIYTNGTNVGIGTTPGDKLHIAATDPQLRLEPQTGGTFGQFYLISSNAGRNADLYLTNQDIGNIYLRTKQSADNPLRRVTIQNDGKVGIMTETPVTPLHVVGGITSGIGITIQDVLTDATNKAARIKIAHYTNAEEPVTMFIGASTNTNNYLNIGGGSASENAMKNINFYTAADQVTLSGTLRMIIDPSGNIGFGTSTFGASAAGVIGIKNGTAPSSSPADMVQLYAEDVTGSSEFKVRDEAGNVTTLSPHNFSLFEPSLDIPFPWSYYSRNDTLGIEINVDMAGAIMALEALTGKKFIHMKATQPSFVAQIGDLELPKWIIDRLDAKKVKE